jgi:uncharacterized protein DUF5703/concanavalin A-like lectin/glucanase superfamily protein
MYSQKLFRYVISGMLFICVLPIHTVMGGTEEKEFNRLETYNEVWETPSQGSSGSMPLGNGDIGLNVWVEEEGDLCFYISKTDAWDENGRLLKVGKVRVSLTPNPFLKGRPFRQELYLGRGAVEIMAGEGPQEKRLRVWVDANHPVVRVSVSGEENFEVNAKVELWRTKQETLSAPEVSDLNFFPDLFGPAVVQPDVVYDDKSDRVIWYHHNQDSTRYALNMKLQGLADYPIQDPLKDRIFGALMEGDGFKKKDRVTLQGSGQNTYRLNINVHTAHPTIPKEWLQAIFDQQKQVEKVSWEVALQNHSTWWEQFWQRSYIYVRSNAPEAGASLLQPNDWPVRIGIDQNGQNKFRGEIRQVHIFQRALPEGRIKVYADMEPKALDRAEEIGRSCGERSKDWDRSSGLTLAAWVKPAKLGQAGARIIDKTTPGKTDGFLLDTYPGNSLRLITETQTLTVKNCLTPDEWHHVAAVIDVSAGVIKSYHNGKVVAEHKQDVTEEGFAVTRGYVLQRFIDACGGRGPYPIKFNGAIFTVDYSNKPGFADYRRWGPGYWWQNTRLPYMSMPAAGDFDLMQPFFRMYHRMLPLCEYRTRKSFGHGGAYYPECIYFWGAMFTKVWGEIPFAQREEKVQESPWHRYEWVSGLEMAAMMYEYYIYSQDEDFLQKTLLPFAEAVVRFFDEHYPVDANGKMVHEPAMALETWWDCTNAMPEVAGLHTLTRKMKQLPQERLTREQQELWERMTQKLPAIPTREVEGQKLLAPAQRFENKRNIENPELYAVYPFKLYGIGKPDIELAQRALANRWDRGHSGWRQDDIFMALLGQTEPARSGLVQRCRRWDTSQRFPAFWGPNYDWTPDQDHGGVLMKTLQVMLLQCDDQEIRLLPAWPKAWDVDFKLRAPYQTTIQGSVRRGEIIKLEVLPKARKGDIIYE